MAAVESVRMPPAWKFLLRLDDSPLAATTFEHTLRITRRPQTMAPGATPTLAFDLIWELDEGTPPMLALIHTDGIEVTLTSGVVVRSRPATFLLRSRSDLRGALSLPPGVAAEVEALPGWKAPGVQRLLMDAV